MTLYVVIVLDKETGPYIWTDSLESAYANYVAAEATHETGFRAIVKAVEIETEV